MSAMRADECVQLQLLSFFEATLKVDSWGGLHLQVKEGLSPEEMTVCIWVPMCG